MFKFKIGDKVVATFTDSVGNKIIKDATIMQIHHDGTYICEVVNWGFDYFREHQLQKCYGEIDIMDCNDVKVFFSEWQRMCNFYTSTNNAKQCPFHTTVNCGCASCFALEIPSLSGEKLDQLVRTVQKWSDEHPVVIDWFKVPVNTPVLVRNKGDFTWLERHLVAYLPRRCTESKFAVFSNVSMRGSISQEDALGIDYYYECKLADSVDPTPYYKEVGENE